MASNARAPSREDITPRGGLEQTNASGNVLYQTTPAGVRQ